MVGALQYGGGQADACLFRLDPMDERRLAKWAGLATGEPWMGN
jgi:hypothetical protein